MGHANTNRNEETNDKKKIIWVKLPYLGHIGDEMKKTCFKNVQKCLTEKVCFFTRYGTKRWLCFVQPKTLFPHSKSQMLFIV